MSGVWQYYDRRQDGNTKTIRARCRGCQVECAGIVSRMWRPGLFLHWQKKALRLSRRRLSSPGPPGPEPVAVLLLFLQPAFASGEQHGRGLRHLTEHTAINTTNKQKASPGPGPAAPNTHRRHHQSRAGCTAPQDGRGLQPGPFLPRVKRDLAATCPSEVWKMITWWL